MIRLLVLSLAFFLFAAGGSAALAGYGFTGRPAFLFYAGALWSLCGLTFLQLRRRMEG